MDKALETLMKLGEGGRLVGIISHVPELRSRIDARLEVRPTEKGSVARFVTEAWNRLSLGPCAHTGQSSSRRSSCRHRRARGVALDDDLAPVRATLVETPGRGAVPGIRRHRHAHQRPPRHAGRPRHPHAVLQLGHGGRPGRVARRAHPLRRHRTGRRSRGGTRACASRRTARSPRRRWARAPTWGWPSRPTAGAVLRQREQRARSRSSTWPPLRVASDLLDRRRRVPGQLRRRLRARRRRAPGSTRSTSSTTAW